MERDDREDADVIDQPVHFAQLGTRLEVAPQQLGEHRLDPRAPRLLGGRLSQLREDGVIQ